MKKLIYGLMVLSCCLNTGCQQWEEPVKDIEVAIKGLHSGAFSSNGQYAVVGSIYHGGSYWRIRDAERLFNWNHRDSQRTTIIAAAISPEGEWALTADPQTMVLWQLPAGTAHHFWTSPGEILDIALGSNGDFAAIATAEFAAVVFDVKNGGVLATFNHSNRVRSVALATTKPILISGSEDSTAVSWDINTGKKLAIMHHNDDVQLVAVSPDGTLAMSAAKYDKAIIWDTSTGLLKGQLPVANEKLKRGIRVTSAVFSSDNQLLLTGRPDRIVQLWSLDSEIQLLKQWRLPIRFSWRPSSASVIAVAFDTEVGVYFAASSDGFIHQLNE